MYLLYSLPLASAVSVSSARRSAYHAHPWSLINLNAKLFTGVRIHGDERLPLSSGVSSFDIWWRNWRKFRNYYVDNRWNSNGNENTSRSWWGENAFPLLCNSHDLSANNSNTRTLRIALFFPAFRTSKRTHKHIHSTGIQKYNKVHREHEYDKQNCYSIFVVLERPYVKKSEYWSSVMFRLTYSSAAMLICSGGQQRRILFTKSMPPFDQIYFLKLLAWVIFRPFIYCFYLK